MSADLIVYFCEFQHWYEYLNCTIRLAKHSIIFTSRKYKNREKVREVVIWRSNTNPANKQKGWIYPSASCTCTSSTFNLSHSLARRSLPCYDSVRERLQPIQGWSDLSHFPQLVQAIDSTQRWRLLLIPPASELLTSLAISLYHLLNADGCGGC